MVKMLADQQFDPTDQGKSMTLACNFCNILINFLTSGFVRDTQKFGCLKKILSKIKRWIIFVNRAA